MSIAIAFLLRYCLCCTLFFVNRLLRREYFQTNHVYRAHPIRFLLQWKFNFHHFFNIKIDINHVSSLKNGKSLLCCVTFGVKIEMTKMRIPFRFRFDVWLTLPCNMIVRWSYYLVIKRSYSLKRHATLHLTSAIHQWKKKKHLLRKEFSFSTVERTV